MAHANRLSRGDLRRNARLERLRRVVSHDRAVLAVDLADDKQVVVVCDHDSRVLARRTWRCRPWQLGKALGWGLGVACRQGFAGVVVACEPTGHRWRVLVEHASRLGLEAVCVQPLLVWRAREAEDFTRDKSDDKDALLIARLTTQLHCYLPEQPTAAWARLRHLGNRRVEQLALATAAQQRLRDLLECGWPAALEVTRHPLDSLTWRAAMTVGRCDPARIRRLAWPALPGRSPASCLAGVGGDATSPSWERCPPPPATTAGAKPSGPGRWSEARWSWPTSSRRWPPWPRSRPPWPRCWPSSIWSSW
jgi:transposase